MEVIVPNEKLTNSWKMTSYWIDDIPLVHHIMKQLKAMKPMDDNFRFLKCTRIARTRHFVKDLFRKQF
jgi:hypothetical protein